MTMPLYYRPIAAHSLLDVSALRRSAPNPEDTASGESAGGDARREIMIVEHCTHVVQN